MAQYSSKLTFGPETADWQKRFNPERMRTRRVARAQAIMKKHGVAALLEANHHNIRYLTALRGFVYPMCRYALFLARRLVESICSRPSEQSEQLANASPRRRSL